ncbi:hypothetical protein HYH03_002433 [Edaphochlamys debaryana]|uniref:Uncharacterized protein n=1 Tax=Edaphochlamys debaryana TaxID=47281 RepID=A0A835YBB9_9CHLO|nr:hypothetical protein HYH03_002433 [Edaphochlamys debaryana]|eukprot:KAG2499486.1 hypothetical protein HYH03_002433 [Edaphochlamys debaryana]
MTARALAQAYRPGDLALASVAPLQAWFGSGGGSADAATAADGLSAPVGPPYPPDVVLLGPAGPARDSSLLAAVVEWLVRRPPPRGCVGALLLTPSRERAEGLMEAAWALGERLSGRGLGLPGEAPGAGEAAAGAAAAGGEASGRRSRPEGSVLHVMAAHGGTTFRDDVSALRASPPELLIATPGRAAELLSSTKVKLSPLFCGLGLLAVDGAELLAEPGLLGQVEQLLRLLPNTPLSGPAAIGHRRDSPGTASSAPLVTLLAATPPLTRPRAGAGAQTPAPVQSRAAAPGGSGTAVQLGPDLGLLASLALRPGFVVASLPRMAAAGPGPTAAEAGGSGAAAAAAGWGPGAAAGGGDAAGAGQGGSLAAAVAAALPRAAAALLGPGLARAQQQGQPLSLPPVPLHVFPLPYREHLPYLYVILRQHMLAQGRHKVVVQLPAAKLASLYAKLFQALGFPAAEAHTSRSDAGRAAAVRDFAAGPRGLLFATPELGAAAAADPRAAVTLIVWVGVPRPGSQVVGQMAAVQQAGAAAALGGGLGPAGGEGGRASAGGGYSEDAVPSGAGPAPPVPRCLLLIPEIDGAAAVAAAARVEEALAAAGLGRVVPVQPGPWAGPLEAVQRRVGLALGRVAPSVKQRGLEGLLGHLWASHARGGAGGAALPLPLPPPPPQALAARGQAPRSPPPPAAPALGAEQLGLWARQFAATVGLPQPPLLSRFAAARMGLGLAGGAGPTGVVLVAAYPPPLGLVRRVRPPPPPPEPAWATHLRNKKRRLALRAHQQRLREQQEAKRARMAEARARREARVAGREPAPAAEAEAEAKAAAEASVEAEGSPHAPGMQQAKGKGRGDEAAGPRRRTRKAVGDAAKPDRGQGGAQQGPSRDPARSSAVGAHLVEPGVQEAEQRPPSAGQRPKRQQAQAGGREHGAQRGPKGVPRPRRQQPKGGAGDAA